MKLTEHKGRYLKAIDFPKPGLLTIKDGTVDVIEDPQNGKCEKDVLWFEEVDQGLVLNKTNASAVVEITGTDDTDQMAGKKLVLYKTTTDFGGKKVDCIRVRAPKAPPPAVTEEQPDDDIPF